MEYTATPFPNRKTDRRKRRLAAELAETGDTAGVAKIVGGLRQKSAAVVNDCIKALYEIGYRKSGLIAPYADLFIDCLRSRNNRLVWGACIALAQIAELASDRLYDNIDTIYRIYERGGVITRDNCVSVFAGIIKGNRNYEKAVFPLILSHLERCRPKEVGQHAERAIVCVTDENAAAFKAVLLKRYDSLAAPQRKRVDSLLRKIDKNAF